MKTYLKKEKETLKDVFILKLPPPNLVIYSPNGGHYYLFIFF